jgi:hypothetical protein
MVTIVKHEWHQHDRQYAIEIDEALLSEIYPDKEEDEIKVILDGISDGTYDYEDVINVLTTWPKHNMDISNNNYKEYNPHNIMKLFKKHLNIIFNGTLPYH